MSNAAAKNILNESTNSRLYQISMLEKQLTFLSVTVIFIINQCPSKTNSNYNRILIHQLIKKSISLKKVISVNIFVKGNIVADISAIVSSSAANKSTYYIIKIKTFFLLF